MRRPEQIPAPGSQLLACAGDMLEITLRIGEHRPGEAFFRTNLGQAAMRRHEIVAHTESDIPLLARDWHDIPLLPLRLGVFFARIPLLDVGWFSGKAYFLPRCSNVPEWPEGDNLVIKVGPAHAACANTVYTAFVRQFGASRKQDPRDAACRKLEEQLDARGYAVIPPSGTFRDLIRSLDTILGVMRFRILQLLPIHPAPTTFARMGRYGCPFAGLDFLAVDPSLAEFDRQATPMDQFHELVDAVHARGGRLFLDMPANHTGWASTLQNHHPEWFRRAPDGTFISPGAWGITWADLVELDYRFPELRAFMADVFLFWVRQGVDGFRCDAGYMIPVETWNYIVARVRAEFPDTVFLLEGLGGKLEVTEQLISHANLDWAYSELFQTADRGAFEQYLPGAMALSARTGPLIHYAETHDNSRLAEQGDVYARMRTALAAMVSQQGAFGIANGVEWFATEKIDVHGASSLHWGAPHHQLNELARLNMLLAQHPAFAAGAGVRLVQEGEGNVLAVVRSFARPEDAVTRASLLVLVNLNVQQRQPVQWPESAFGARQAWDLLSGAAFHPGVSHRLELEPGQVLCLSDKADDLLLLDRASHLAAREPEAIQRRRRNLLALRVRHWLTGADTLGADDADALGTALAQDPLAYSARLCAGSMPRVTVWDWPEDARRHLLVPPGFLLLIRAPHSFRARLWNGSRVVAGEESLALSDTRHIALLPVPVAAQEHVRLTLALRVFLPDRVVSTVSDVLALVPGAAAQADTRFSGTEIRAGAGCYAVLGNGRGATAQVRAQWGEIRSQYDALLAVNPDPHVPVDRRIFFTRCRAWLRHNGYSHAIDATCLDRFEADPGGRFASWQFKVPTGLGCWVVLVFRLVMTRGRNRVHLEISRQKAVDGLADDSAVTVVLRPDVEWRNFHGKTKAYAGPETHWPAAIQAEAHGFVFCPEPGETCSIRIQPGQFHTETQWTYMVGHPDDAERGLDGSSDLFSPGWFGLDLLGGEQAVLTAEREDAWSVSAEKRQASLAAALPPSAGFCPLPEAIRQAMDVYVVQRDDLLTVLAGYPWFLDWGRDTLIVLRGLVADGRTAESLRILREFGRFEKNGTLPNMIRGNDDSNRDTSDAPLWFGVAAADLMAILGSQVVLDAPCGRRTLRDVLVSIATHYREGTPNGIRMDRASGLIYSPSHFTWMDTNFPAATPREGYPVEIQALWIAFLDLLGQHVDPSWREVAALARKSLAGLFWLRDEGWLADNLSARAGVPAAQAVADDALRPNQLLAITLGAYDGERARVARVLQACETLLVPGGIRSLADRPVRHPLPVWRDGVLLNDPHHPYCGRYSGDEDTCRKPAYHNGTAWTWQFPLYAEALVRLYGDEARPAALALLGSATIPLNSGCIGQMPEVLDGDAPHFLRGCGAQAWGVSELLRVWKRVQGQTADHRNEEQKS
ncbi:MAG: amylo-alpha-1,6-glucosidase [Kiritimatiellia bacterium]